MYRKYCFKFLVKISKTINSYLFLSYTKKTNLVLSDTGFPLKFLFFLIFYISILVISKNTRHFESQSKN